jgi:invasion protein IalB
MGGAGANIFGAACLQGAVIAVSVQVLTDQVLADQVLTGSVRTDRFGQTLKGSTPMGPSHQQSPQADRRGASTTGFVARIAARLLGGGIATALLLGMAVPASAQGAVRSVHGDWQIRCDTPPGAKAEQCALIQSVVAEDRSNAGLTVIVLKTADQKSKLMRVVAPLGVLLPSGLGLKLDNVDVGRAGFVRCLPNGCVAEVVMDDKLLGQIRTAKTATFIIFETPEEGIGFPLSLNGLAEGYDKLPRGSAANADPSPFPATALIFKARSSRPAVFRPPDRTDYVTVL